MSGPLALMRPRTRAGRTSNEPFSGKPATIASSPLLASCGAEPQRGRVAGPARRGRRCRAASRRARPWRRTSGPRRRSGRSARRRRRPRARWSSPGAWPKTKPVPSRTLPQLGAVPTTLTMDCCARAATGLLASAGSGGGTSVIGSLRERAEDLREAVLREDRGEVGEPGVGLRGHHPGHPEQHLGAADLLAQRRQRRAGQGGADQPGDQQHRQHVDQRAAGRVQGAGRATR